MTISFRLSDARRLRRRREGSGIALRPPEAASGGADLQEPSRTAAANWRCYDVLDAGVAGAKYKVREKRDPRLQGASVCR
uniref:Uncharacterized protein n=4 Tax=Agrobacterium TaxID=357 RepID=A0A2Z2PZ84_AGRTU|nr:hypothetical protein [Agrobacterium tomkonis]ASK47492.1 hypothetical protein [Agrobacterium fabrum]ASK47662.1 hypothetical protein [Agrobacterium radiobacter]ASK47840.1 hypothetical protein [Agrobacterium radiobacter]ASK48010.1 hypothetical protein [Agrobacterium deltaense]